MAVGRGVVVDVRADDRIRAASAPFAMGKFALEGLELMQALGNWEKGILIQRCIDVFSELQLQTESKLSWHMGAFL